MKLIELHVLQSFPVSCLNRDDVNAPKTATFGGVTRARISSQCLKRAIRRHAKELCPPLYQGERSRLIVEPIAEAATRHGAPADKAMEASRALCGELATLDEKALNEKEVPRVKTLMFLSPSERDEIGKELAGIIAQSRDAKTVEKKIKTAASKVAEARLKDAADIAIFGRMVASDHSLTVEGAGLFSHALSTHRAANDIDFFSAVDDLQPREESGAGMTGTLEFTSAVYYRYIGLNLGLLWDDGHLAALSPEDRKAVLGAFIRASILAVPGARKNSMNAHTLPGYVLGLVKNEGQPMQLVNAFEEPVRADNGLMQPSIDRLKVHHADMVKTWGFSPSLEVAIPESTLDKFCGEILRHV